MRRALPVIGAVAALAIPAAADAGYEQTYFELYKQDREQNGKRSPGCYLLSNYFGNKCAGKASRADVLESTRTLRNHVRVVRPRPAPVAAPSASYAAPSTAQAPTATTAGGPEQFAQCESGGETDPWTAVNESSGAYGKYQIMPMHWNGGMCSDLGRDPAGQTTCANRIYEQQSSSAWSQCGG